MTELRDAPGTRGVDTHCPYCALQCAMTLTATEEGTVEVAPRDFPTNQGGLCQKGWTSAALLDHPRRLTHPLVRGADGELRRASWEEAMDLVVTRLHGIREADGPDAIGVFGGGGLTNEKAYTLGKFARLALRTAMIDYNGRFCMSSAAAAGNRAFGVDRGLPFPLPDLQGADAVLLVGSNVADTMPPFVAHLDGVRRRRGLVVVDPRFSATAGLTSDGQGLHLRALPGSDQVLLLGLLHLLVAEGRVDHDYLAQRTSGWDDVRRAVAAWWPQRVADRTGVPESQLRAAARLLAAASPAGGGRGAYVLTGRGAEQHVDGTDTVTTAVNLALALGLPGRVGSGYGCLTGQGNGQGGREHGQKSDQLPGYRMITDPAAREHVARVWGVAPDVIPGAGVPAVELLRRLGRPADQGGVRALMVHGSNPAVSAPDAGAVTSALRSLDLLVVCDLVPNETTALADVVLPVAQWAEEDGTMTNLEGRILRRRRAVDPPGEVRDELAVLADLAARLGCPVPLARDAAAVTAELAAASAGGRADYGALTLERAGDEPDLHWPVGADAPQGTPRLFTERFAHPDGLARMVATTPPTGPADDVRAARPYYLVTGRVLAHYQSGAQTRLVDALARSADGAHVEIHPRTARTVGVGDGDRIEVTSDRGRVVAPARLTRSIRPDTVFVPFHWPGEGRANSLTTSATDPVSGMPEFKTCAVSLAPAPAPAPDPVAEEIP
ncbi:molybdopterin oxidoreductase family protein [Nocardioidaceae bacterium]|nr:molybdopterin oxidoreductase family protein [Nocardioidaceae bacterium]